MFVMYCVNGESGSSLLIESTDSMIIIVRAMALSGARHAKCCKYIRISSLPPPCLPQYDEYKPPMDNIGLQDSLLSRFDLIFVVLDEMDPEQDRRISEHVLRMHRFRNPGEQVRL